ncbi:MAG: regulatory iron-sulfur-containing complex subunit RicT [Lentisphaeria bacterium]|nr:regulatory iron-sulfur-containing complex subunit RicT [Lentisphaeria bacterium]
MMQLYKVSVTNGVSYECMGDVDLQLGEGDAVVVRCERYHDYGVISKVIGEPVDSEEALEKVRLPNSRGRRIEGQRLPPVIRRATEEDIRQARENEAQAAKAHLATMERIKAHNLDMKLIHTHYALDRKLLVFQFSAEGRVDFRELLRDLSALFRVRVELLQIGVRDEAAVLGGIGTCGRPFCCASYLTGFSSINVKMAKQQGLSLNPQNISGACGRLKCCLQFEAETYRAMAQEQRRQKQADSGQDGDFESGGDVAPEGVDASCANCPGHGGGNGCPNAAGPATDRANEQSRGQRGDGRPRRNDRSRRGNPQGRGQQQNGQGRQGQGQGGNQQRKGGNPNQSRQSGPNQGKNQNPNQGQSQSGGGRSESGPSPNSAQSQG